MEIITKTTITADFSVQDLQQILVDILTNSGKITSGTSRMVVITEPDENDYGDRYPSPDVFKGLRIINEN